MSQFKFISLNGGEWGLKMFLKLFPLTQFFAAFFSDHILTRYNVQESELKAFYKHVV